MRLIDADKLITALEITITKSDTDFESEYLNGIKQGIETALEIVKIAPTIEWTDIELMGYVNGEQITKIRPSKIDGHWITRYGYPHKIYCSICKVTFADEKWEVWKDGSLPRNYCPNCGAKMINQDTLIDKVGPVFEQIAEMATNFFEDETISGLLEEGEE
jgi:hypothetical protein